MPTRARPRSTIAEQLDRSAHVVTLSWGRSVRTCDACGGSGQPAGYELKVDGRLVERLCSSCSGAATVPELLAAARARGEGRAA